MSAPTFLICDNYHHVVSGVEDMPDRAFIVLSRIRGGSFCTHNERIYLRLDMDAESPVTVDFDTFKSAAIGSAVWLVT